MLRERFERKKGKNFKKVLEERKRLLPLPPRNERDEGWEDEGRGIEAGETSRSRGKMKKVHWHFEALKEEIKPTIEFDIVEDKSPFDNKKIIYLVKVKNELSKQEFTEVKQKLAKLNGFYSSLKDGFIFKYDPKEKLII